MLDRDYYNKYIRQYYAFGYHDGDFDYEEKSLKAKIEISDNIEVIKECKKKLEALNLVQTQRRKGFYYGYDSYGDIVLKRDVKNNHNDIFDYLPQIILLIFIVIYLLDSGEDEIPNIINLFMFLKAISPWNFFF